MKSRYKLWRKIARLHQRISDTRKDWHFKLAHKLCDDAGMIFVEDIDFRVWARGMFCKHTLDAGFGQFVSILQWVCWKRGVYFAKVDKDYTSQVCPQCDAHTGKKELGDTANHHRYSMPNLIKTIAIATSLHYAIAKKRYLY
ncbi:MAG: transposase [Nostocales cyanobacterium 94392]|nr:transposase [Nostocales cyanobacterium 94392]